MATLVQIKRSTSNVSPATLNEGELAYSYVSNVIFIGDTVNGVMNIGGQYYTDLIDNATAANSASTIVRRHANGTAQFEQLDIIVSPTSNSHVATKEYVDTSISSNVSLNVLTDIIVVGTDADQNNRILVGHANGDYITTDVTGNVSLSNVGVFTIGNSQVTNAMLEGSITNDKLANDSVTITAGPGLANGGIVALGSAVTLDVNAGDGLSNTSNLHVDGTVVRTDRNQTVNGSLTFSNTIYFTSDIDVTGNIFLNGNTTYINVATLNVTDPLIYLAANNDLSDIVDIGFMAGKNTAGVYSHTGLIRHAADGNWYLFDGLAEEGHENNIVDVANTTYALLRANLEAQQLNVTTGFANINTTLEVVGNTSLYSNLSVSDSVTVGETLSVSGDVTVNTNKIQLFASNGDAILEGDLTVSGGDIVSSATANLLNVTSTTINFGGVATAISIGAATGNTTINHNLDVANNLVVAEFSRSNTYVSTKTALAEPNLTHFDGERLRLYDFDEIGHPNYAIGVEQNHIWTGVDSSANNQGFKWYGNTSQAMRLSGNGVLEVANTIITERISANVLTLLTPLGTSSGGTGVSSFTANGVWYANTTSTLDFATGSEGEVLQIASGVPAFAMLDGGSF